MIKNTFLLTIILLIFACSSSVLDDPSTTIQFSVSEQSQVKLTVENSYDTIISILIDREMPAGTHQVIFVADNLAEGVYYYTLEIRGISSSNYYKKTRTMLLVK